MHDMRSDLFGKLMGMPMSFFNRTKFGRIVSRMTSDIDAVRVGVQDVAYVSTVQALQMTGSAALMAWYNWKLFMLMLLLAPLIWVVNQRYRLEASHALRKVQESWSRLTSTLAESVNGIRVTQAFVRHEINAGFFRKLLGVHAENNIGAARPGSSGVRAVVAVEAASFFSGAMAWLGGYGALRWHGCGCTWRWGIWWMFFFLANLFFDPLQVIGNQYNQALTAMAGAERFFRLMDIEPEWRDLPGARTLPRIEGRVEFAGGAFRV